MCPSSRQARCTVKPPRPAGNSQTINKHVQTNKSTLAGVELISPGLQLMVLADALTIWANRPVMLQQAQWKHSDTKDENLFKITDKVGI